MKPSTYLMVVFALLAVHVLAQERTAGSTVESQMNWSSLSGSVTNVNTRIDDANKRLGYFITCAKKGMLYVPGEAGVDADGCKLAVSAPVLGACYHRGGGFGVHVTCQSGEVITSACTSGGGANCVAPGGTIMDSSQSALDGWRQGTTTATPQTVFTVLTCCKIQ